MNTTKKKTKINKKNNNIVIYTFKTLNWLNEQQTNSVYFINYIFCKQKFTTTTTTMSIPDHTFT